MSNPDLSSQARIPAHRSPTEPAVNALLAHWARERPFAVALASGKDVKTFSELNSDVARLAIGLQAQGVRSGERVALHMPNVTEAVVTMLACMRISACVVPINTRYTSEEIATLLRLVRPVLFLGHTALWPTAAEASAATLGRDSIYVAGAPTMVGRPWQDLLAGEEPPAFPEDVPSLDTEQPLVLLGTSGTTGDSKLVAYTRRVLDAIVAAAPARHVDDGETILPMLSMMHAGGCLFTVGAVGRGATLVLSPFNEADEVLDLAERHQVTWVMATPVAMASLMDRQQARPRRIGSVRFWATAGDICPLEVERRVAEVAGQPLFSLWGTTEDPSAMLPTPAASDMVRPMPDTETKLVGPEDGGPVGEGASGSLHIRSASTSPGYWRDGVVVPHPDGWFDTGDLMRREPNGSFRIMGRTKDLIIRGGSNVSPVEVEAVLRRHPAVTDVAVAGLADPVLGQRVVALCSLDAAANADPEEILTFARTHLADYKVPEHLAITDAIPRNAMGKADRRKIAGTVSQLLGAAS